MLIAALRAALPVVRRAGAGAVALALLSFAPLALTTIPWMVPFAAATFTARMVVVFALVRYLAACRPEPPPPPAEVDEFGQRVAAPASPVGPVTPDDRSVRRALRVGGKLLRPALRVTLLQFLVLLTAPLLLVALGGNTVEKLDETQSVLLVLPLAALGMAFIALVPQRIAIEGDPRVLVATAHSVRIARQAYGSLLALNLAQPAILAVALVTIGDAAATAGTVAAAGGLFALSLAVEVVGLATATEIYLAGPRLDVPAELGTRPRR